MTCKDALEKIGPLLDSELDAPARAELEQHLASCTECDTACESLRGITSALSDGPDRVTVPRDEIWRKIEQHLDTDSPATVRPIGSRPVRLFSLRPLASAAVVLAAIGLGWLFVSAPWSSAAYAGQIDFRPLLEQADGDIKAGIDALIDVHGGRAITRPEAADLMRIRIDSPANLPPGLSLQSLYLLNLGGDHRALGFHYHGPQGHLLLLQCPPDVEQNLAGHECLPCRIGTNEGHVARIGSLRLAHFGSDNVCVCVVSTLDEMKELPAALNAVKIDF